MPSVGPLNGQTFASTGTGDDWTNPGRAIASDNSYATSANQPRYLTVTNLDGAPSLVPDGVIINGVKVEVEALAEFSVYHSIKLIKGGVVVGDDKSTGAAPAGDGSYDSFGGVADGWGAELTAAAVNAADFGVAVSIWNAGFPAGVSIDHVRVTVYYTPVLARSVAVTS